MREDPFEIICNECRSPVAGGNENCPHCGASMNGGGRVRPVRDGGVSLPDIWIGVPGPRANRVVDVRAARPGGGRWIQFVGLFVLALIVASICYLIVR